MKRLRIMNTSYVKISNLKRLLRMIKPKATMVMLLAASLLGGGTLRTQAQAASDVASHFIQITEDVIKPGDFKEYARLQQEKAKALKAANWKRVSIGLTNLYGPGAKVYHYSFYKSFDVIENDRELIAKNAELAKALV